MDWMLSDEERYELQARTLHIEGVTVADYERELLKAQARKLVEWLNGSCSNISHQQYWIVKNSPRYHCSRCITELRKEVGLEATKDG